MKRKLFTFLMAFLATLSGAVWAVGSGTPEDPWVIDLENPIAVGDAFNRKITIDDDAISIHAGGYYRITGTTSNYHINIGYMDVLGALWYGPQGENETVYLIFDNVTMNSPSPLWFYNPRGSGEDNELFVDITLVGENHLTSSNNSAAIEVNGDSNLTINGNGSLYATGSIGIGDPTRDGIVGDITINSGTVVANGTSGAGFGGTNDNGTNLNINGNAFVVSNGTGNVNENFQQGIYYDSSEQNNTAEVKGDVTLDSNYPSVSDILGSELKLDIADGATLTLGEGISFSTTRLANTNDEDKLYAYKVTYDLNNNIKLGDMDYTITVNGTVPQSMYAGPNVTLAELPTATNNEQTWQAMAWGKEGSGTFQEVTATPSTPNNITTAANSNAWNVKNIWAVQKWTTIQVTQYGIMDNGIQLFYPQEAASLYTLTGGESLTQYGAKLETETNEKNQVVPEGSVTAEVNEAATDVTLTITGKDKTIVLPFKVNENPNDLKDAVITTKNMEYNSNPVDASKIIETATLDGTTIGYTNITLQYKKDNNGSAGEDLTSAPKDAGTYWVRMQANGTNFVGESDYVKFEITKASAVVTAEDVEWTIGESTGPTFTDALTATGVGEDKLTVSSFTQPTGPWTESGIYNVTYTDIRLSDETNYNKIESVNGKLTVKATGTDDKPIDPNPDDEKDGEDPIIKPGDEDGNTDGWTWDATNNQWTRVYDGVSHPFTSITITYTDETAEGGTKTEKLTVGDGDTDVKVTYSTDDEQTVTEIKNHGTYYAHIKINKEDAVISGVVEPIKLYIDQRPMDVTINQITAEDLDETSVTAIGATYEVFNAETNRGLVEAEKEYAGISGTMSVTPKESTTEGTKEYTVTFSGLALASSGGDNPTFLAANYAPTFKYGNTTLTDGSGTVDITIEDITPGNDTEISDGDGDENDWTWNGEYYVVTYDGNPHGIAQVDGKEPTKVTYSTTDGNAPVNAGYYTATVIVEGKTGRFNLWIKQRPLTVNFNLSSITEEQIGKTLDANGYVAFSGNVTGETPLLDDEATITIADKANANGKYAVTFDNILLVTNEKFLPNNYTPTYYLNGELIVIDENGDGTSGGEGDDEGGITITPDKDDDNDPNHGHGGNTPGGDGKIDYYNMYVDTAATCDGVELSFSKNVVREGNQVSVYVDKILEGYNADDMKLWFKRSLYGYWEELEEGVQPGEYIIYNVYTDIYVKTTDVEKNPTGIEEIEGVKVYAQDGSLYVYTPKQMPIWIVSMTGAIVRHEEQIGLHQYDHLNQGIYIVRVGEQVFKIRL